MTAQVHEILIFNGKESSMAFCPPIPETLDTVIKLSDDEVEKQIKNGEIDDDIFSTACWRDYIGTWEIKDGKFYLKDIVGRYKKVSRDPLFAEWFSGVIRIPKGNILQGVHMGFGSVYENEIHIKIENGIIVKQREVCNVGKKFDRHELTMKNLPGGEHLFNGDDF
jgi:hypothetical protein